MRLALDMTRVYEMLRLSSSNKQTECLISCADLFLYDFMIFPVIFAWYALWKEFWSRRMRFKLTCGGMRMEFEQMVRELVYAWYLCRTFCRWKRLTLRFAVKEVCELSVHRCSSGVFRLGDQRNTMRYGVVIPARNTTFFDKEVACFFTR